MQFKHLLALAALATATAATAAPDRSKTYVLVDVGASQLSGVDEQASKTAMGATFGVKLDRNLAVETSYKNLGNRFDLKFDAFTFSAVSSLPVNRSLDFVGKLGVAHTAASASESGLTLGLSHTGFVAGAGLDFRLNRSWAVRTLVDYYPDFAGSDDAVTSVTVGLKYSF